MRNSTTTTDFDASYFAVAPPMRYTCASLDNPWIGCTRVSPGCDHCYAAVSTPSRAMHVVWGPGEQRHRTAESTWEKPHIWNKRHDAFFAKHGRRQRVFCASLADVFDNAVDPAWRLELFQLIAQTPNLDWLLLTKRIGNARGMLNDVINELSHGLNTWDELPWPGVWIGATIVNQDEADRDIPKLLGTPAGVKFLSMEPLLGSVNITDFLSPGYPRCDTGFVQGSRYAQGYCGTCAGHITDPIHGAETRDFIDWVIVGGESGYAARPMAVEWAQDIVQQCRSANVSVFVKQLGARPTNHEGVPYCVSDRKGAVMADWPEILRVREIPEAG